MKISAHPVLAKATHVSDLPSAWGTLAELARFEPAEDAARRALEIRLRAERRVGELLDERVDHTGGGVARHDTTKQLPDGISRAQSSRWQRIAPLPDEVLEHKWAKPESAELNDAPPHVLIAKRNFLWRNSRDVHLGLRRA